MSARIGEGLTVFSTCPQSKDESAASYLDRVIEVSRWSEEFGCAGMLVYTDNGLVDPWLVAQVVLENTERLGPLVAVQPLYMHPYTAAKMIASYGFMYGRKVYVNMLAGGFRTDLLALGDATPHDERYARTTEYTLVMKELLSSSTPVTFEGKYYNVKNLTMKPALDPELFPGILISGSSDAGMQAARDIGATAIRYPEPPSQEIEASLLDVDAGVRIGIIARSDRGEAWRVALERFPEDRKGRVAHKLAMKLSDSSWHHTLSELEERPDGDDNPYWLGPFKNYKTFCPYLVGTYERVAEEVAGYIRRGYRTFILDIPPSREELEHVARVFELSTALAEAERVG